MRPESLIFQSWLKLIPVAILLLVPSTSTRAQSVRSIQSPLPEEWVVDKTETLSDLQKRLIGELCEEIQTDYNRQMVVAVIDSTNGRDHRRFAVELFNQWRVGAGYKNQGVLVFAAMKDRAAEIILGHGIDNKNTVKAARSIMDNVMIPKFKAGDAGSAIYEGVHACSKRIIGVGKLDVAPKLPEITAEAPVVTAEKPLEPNAELPREKSHANAGSGELGSPESLPGKETETENATTVNAGSESDGPSILVAEADGFRPLPMPEVSAPSEPVAGNQRLPARRGQQARNARSYLPWVLGIGGVGLIGSFLGIRHYLRYRSRMCETCRLDRVLLTEVQDDDFLDRPERIEEKIGSVDYDVWACLECEDVIKLRYGRWLTRYSRCPECSYVTRFKITETVIPATTMNGGLVRVKEYCKSCDYHHTHTYATPRIPQRRSGSSGGSIFSGGMGSSSGGGFSSGGGASGRW